MADNVHFLKDKLDKIDNRTQGIDGSGRPPDDTDMEKRIEKLEEFAGETRERMARMEVRLENVVTSAELHKEISAQTWKLVTFVCGFGTALVAATYFLATHIK
jgi:hypothetical protein